MSAVRRPPSTTEALPKQFVTSLRILFDILDERRQGYVRLCDIESRWHEEGVKGLPSGVIETLRKVTPATGNLTFENFVSGLKLALLKNNPANTYLNGKENYGPPQENNDRKTYISANSRSNLPGHSNKITKQPENHQPKKPVSYIGQSSSVKTSTSNTATVRPNNVLNSVHQNGGHHGDMFRSRDQTSVKHEHDGNMGYGHRDSRSSLDRQGSAHYEKDDVIRRQEYSKKPPPIPRPKSEEIQVYRSRDGLSGVPRHNDRAPGRPERPPSYAKAVENHGGHPGQRSPPVPDPQNPPAVPPRNRNSRIMSELKNWQREQLNNKSMKRDPAFSSDSKLMEKNQISGNEIYVNIEQIRKHATAFNPTASTSSVPTQQKTTVRRQNSRRHTLSSGVDYNMIRRMKQLEQEKDLLMQGLEAIEQTRDWYHRQITDINNKKNLLEKTSYTDTSVEACQEKLDFQRARITEVNHHLRSLLNSNKNFPVHMNLAVRSSLNMQDTTIKMLKGQNKQLTKEVGDKSEKISQLEQEKASLIRELFEAKSKNKSSYDDTTFL